jgi:predicted dehydrogenase
MVKIGVLGAGFLGKIHIKLLKEIPQFEIVGFYDPDDAKVQETTNEFNIRNFTSPEELIDNADAIDIVTPTISHYDYAVNALKKSKHVFIEKPITYTAIEAAALIKITTEANVVVQVGHVERFNPAFTTAKTYFNNPMFIEAHRLSEFNPRGTDVPVVLDLMIHDIDIILSVVKSNVRNISASGLAVISETPDIANARLEFHNGCVANLTSSRVSLFKMRKSRFFQRDAYISVDYLNKETEIVKVKDVEELSKRSILTFDLGNGKVKEFYIEKPEITDNNAIKEELKSFCNSIHKKIIPVVTIEDGYNAINLAYQILDKMKNYRS